MHRIRIIAILASIIALGIVSCASGAKKQDGRDKYSLVGVWEGIDRTGCLGSFHFYENGRVILVIDGRSLGGSESNGLGTLRYSADYSKNPIELDIIGVDSDGIEHGRILMIVHFLSRDQIKIRTFFNEIRPENFDNENIDDTILLDRVVE
ncbi:MAG: hypothetical protein A2176_02595 [Spirochaetes bacterium RBG_13_51_14]|nr:MAG: hypothetical protein A2176_02595 [Spirochaetes bacterium RBG_13_51_14]